MVKTPNPSGCLEQEPLWLQKYLELPQVPDLEGPVIPTAEQEGLLAAPADDVDVPIMGGGSGKHAGLAGGCPDVPDANGGIGRAGGKYLDRAESE